MSTINLDLKGAVVTCASCGRKSRIPYEHLGDTGRCVHCKATIPPPSVPIEVPHDAHFNTLIHAADVPVVVDFWAPWCGPCRMVAPELEKVAASNRGAFVVAKVNTEALPGVAQRFQIRSIPTMAVFAGGREVARTAGARPAAEIEAFIRQALRPKATA